MSFSKSINIHCRRCICLSKRHFQTDSSGTAEPPKMTAKIVSVTQWKILNQLKEYYNKYSTDKTFQQMLNKEFAWILQKIHPSVYGKNVIRSFESTITKDGNTTEKKIIIEETEKNDTKITKSVVIESPGTLKEPTTSQGYSVSNVLHGLGLKIGKTSDVTVVKPKWKTVSAVSKCSVTSRTSHVISMIRSAENDSSKLKRIEDLSAHVQHFPEAKHQAFKEGAIKLLLRIRAYTNNPEIIAAIQEAFAILGYFDPLPNRGIRILSIDGGGTRGLLVIYMLKKLEELTGKRVHEMFDLICGVSTGAIISCALGASQKELLDLQRYYKELSVKIFSQNAFWGTSNLVWSHSYYDTKVWEQILKDYFGETEMIKTSRHRINPKVIAVSSVVNQSRANIYVFRNYSLPYKVRSQFLGGSNHKIWEAVRASAAAPTYFEEFKIGNLLHQDGGIMVNNPTAVAIHEARHIWPGIPIQCVVSFGTGRTDHLDAEPITTGSSSSWKNKFMKILDSATDTESVHQMLNDLLAPGSYYRFNPYLTEMLDMSEIRSEKLDQLERDALMYVRRNDDKFHGVAKTLMEQKPLRQKVIDWMSLQREIMGVTTVK